ncbi:MAG: hypothetical protein IPH26_16145 [Sterolibacteriaceae bacterium]|uniref:Uncharacterized protein n=1 Tax=Candidatus Methylophosphatis roskildensis TaxID=2899263 RepID=A0A9D7E5I3_9PROT|nr:hypothetical protein [Candidatus Methylophosphatis roskildensis]
MDENKPPYLRELLTSQGNVYAVLGAAAAAAVLSIPFGFGVGAIPLIALAAGEAIAAMYVPSSATFRDKVDRKYREAARRSARAHLSEEIQRRAQSRNRTDRTIETYGRMQQRIESLYRLATDRGTQLSVHDVEKLDDASTDYLYARLALLVIEDRAASIELGDIEARVRNIERELATLHPGMDMKQLHKARDDYAALALRHRRMLSRKTALEAALISIPDQMEEIYQTIIAAPTSHEIGAKLTEAVANLRLREDIEVELAGDMEGVLPGLVVPLHGAGANSRRAAASRQMTS